MSEIYQKTLRPRVPRPPSRRANRKTNNLYIELNQAERDALDAEVIRLGIETARYLRTLILAVHAGELPADRLFVE
jgi:hypothetical protein